MQLKHYHNQPEQPSDSVSCGDVSFPLPTNLEIPEHLMEVNLVCPITQAEAVSLEQATVGQTSSSAWFEARRNRLTASQFGKVLKRKRDVNEKFLTTLFGESQFSTQATRYGTSHEGDAKQAYCSRKKGVHLHDCGLVVNPAFSFLGASPDAKVCEDGLTGILEVKCPFNSREKTIQEAVETTNAFCLSVQDGVLSLKKTHDYFYQVHAQLMVTGAMYCDFVVYTSKDIYIERVLPDCELHQTMLNQLSEFYCKYAIPFVQN